MTNEEIRAALVAALRNRPADAGPDWRFEARTLPEPIKKSWFLILSLMWVATWILIMSPTLYNSWEKGYRVAADAPIEGVVQQ